MQQLNYANVNILGFVMNGAMEGSGKKYQYGKYGKYGSYGKYYRSSYYYNNYYN
jgi:Mrp family chromosome partitioning ATPase